MTGFEIAIGIVLIIFSLLIIVVVLLQEGRQANLGAIQGAADSFLDKGKARTLDAILARMTKIIAVTFFVLVFVGMLVTKFLGA
jgi:preprotein translocase subunit SecG